MISATITGGLTTHVRPDDRGIMYCTVYSESANRSVRAILRNARHAELVSLLPKGARLTVSGRLNSHGAISPSGKTLALLSIDVQTMEIHHGEEAAI